jgi:hypothetical protein
MATNLVSLVSLIFMVGFSNCNNKMETEPEIHLIPSHFRGHVIIKFDVQNADAIPYEGKNRVYRIPENGVLESKSKINLGIKPLEKNHFFLFDESNKRAVLPRFNEKGLSPTTIVVSNLFIVGNTYQYFVDELKKINTYKNPAIEENSRE